MKIVVCDPCKTFDNKITETERYLRVKHLSLRTDVCEKHAEELGKLRMVDYVRIYYKLAGITLTETDEEIKLKFLTR